MGSQHFTVSPIPLLFLLMSSQIYFELFLFLVGALLQFFWCQRISFLNSFDYTWFSFNLLVVLVGYLLFLWFQMTPCYIHSFDFNRFPFQLLLILCDSPLNDCWFWIITFTVLKSCKFRYWFQLISFWTPSDSLSFPFKVLLLPVDLLWISIISFC